MRIRGRSRPVRTAPTNRLLVWILQPGFVQRFARRMTVDSLCHQRGLVVAALLKNGGANGVHGLVIWPGERGELHEMASQSQLTLRCQRFGAGSEVAAPPASPANSLANAASAAGFRLAGLPSYQPPYMRQMLRTTNSGSS